MKMRNGFVSNSSSSSFVICGQLFSKEDALKRIGYNHKGDPFEAIEVVGLEYVCDEGDLMAIGLDVEEMNLDETRRAFGSRVEGLLGQIVGDPGAIEFIYGYHDDNYGVFFD